MPPAAPQPQSGFTLLELIVVILLLALASAVVLPSFTTDGSPPQSAVRHLVDAARNAAVRRGRMVRLRIDRTGAWEATVEDTVPERLSTGRLPEPPSGPLDLLFSPLGTCAPPAVLAPSALDRGRDPLTCQAPGS